MIAVPLLPHKPAGTIQPGELYALGVTGKTGKGSRLGITAFGVLQLGYPSSHAGIYRRRRHGFNNKGRSDQRRGGVTYVLNRPYAPTNPRTPEQQANRTKFAEAVASWQILTAEQKAVYNKRAQYTRRTGYALYLKEYMQRQQ